jgi:hypothetical protein
MQVEVVGNERKRLIRKKLYKHNIWQKKKKKKTDASRSDAALRPGWFLR